MFWVRLKIKSLYAEDIVIVLWKYSGDFKHPFFEVKHYKCYWNKMIQKFGVNAFIPFTQTSKKIFIIRYKINNKIIYKKYQITEENYKYNFIIDLENDDEVCCDEDIINSIENKLIVY